MIEADRADHSRAKLDHDLIVPITSDHNLNKSEIRGAVQSTKREPGFGLLR